MRPPLRFLQTEFGAASAKHAINSTKDRSSGGEMQRVCSSSKRPGRFGGLLRCPTDYTGLSTAVFANELSGPVCRICRCPAAWTAVTPGSAVAAAERPGAGDAVRRAAAGPVAAAAGTQGGDPAPSKVAPPDSRTDP
ncbi:hypothetical protein caldi_31610 [Caldinitratiruptor microaerophilus]|uniref:Uncharacterized protein n=1 Tax=Caldinitratiruptor microaerophilus TaxID=671077 RepID=A0AA35G6Z3_9FIRM|nr:hypothetical protein caldi_31610 [Caldinitratiruptor microaerophilus]